MSGDEGVCWLVAARSFEVLKFRETPAKGSSLWRARQSLARSTHDRRQFADACTRPHSMAAALLAVFNHASNGHSTPGNHFGGLWRALPPCVHHSTQYTYPPVPPSDGAARLHASPLSVWPALCRSPLPLTSPEHNTQTPRELPTKHTTPAQTAFPPSHAYQLHLGCRALATITDHGGKRPPSCLHAHSHPFSGHEDHSALRPVANQANKNKPHQPGHSVACQPKWQLRI
jgi:hypothetical protein